MVDSQNGQIGVHVQPHVMQRAHRHAPEHVRIQQQQAPAFSVPMLCQIQSTVYLMTLTFVQVSTTLTFVLESVNFNHYFK